MKIFIESSKTDQYRDGAWVVIARTATTICPVNMTEETAAPQISTYSVE